MEPQYPIRAVAKLTGLSIDTLRAWERRYSAVVPERSDRGRQYSQGQIERLSLLRTLVERGHAIGQIATLSEPALRELLNTTPPETVNHDASPEGSEPLIAPVLEALGKFQHTRVNDELGRLAALLTPRDLIYRVALPLMREVGERWHRGEFGIAQEHLASASLRNVFGSLVRLHPARPDSKRILIATLAGDLHDFAILAAAMIAAINGLDPIFLGANLPAREVAQAAKTTAAEIVLIGYSFAGGSDSRELRELASALPAATDLWIGGQKSSQFDPDAMPSGTRIVPFTTLEDFEARCQRIGGIV